MSDARIARRMWARFESLHDVTYFTPEARAAFEAVGLRGYWRGYFAGRAAPLGEVGASTVIAVFFGFAPSMVARAIPSVWSLASAETTLHARQEGTVAALTTILAGLGDVTEAVAEAAAIAEKAVDLLEPAGHVLGAANAALPRNPDAPALARLWQAATTLREHRGDSHVAALVAYGFDGCESVVWRCPPQFRETMESYRGWTMAEWDAAVVRLTERGWLDASGSHTAEGDAAYTAVEHATDRDAVKVWHSLGDAATDRFNDLVTPIASLAYAAVPVSNPMNVPDPAKADS